jgi:hypothetical protein
MVIAIAARIIHSISIERLVRPGDKSAGISAPKAILRPFGQACKLNRDSGRRGDSFRLSCAIRLGIIQPTSEQ